MSNKLNIRSLSSKVDPEIRGALNDIKEWSLGLVGKNYIDPRVPSPYFGYGLNTPWLDSVNFATLSAADANAVASGKMLVISHQWDIVPDTLAANIKMFPGGKLNGIGAVNITGEFQGCDDCFGANQSVTGMKEVMPQWFGAKPDTVTDQTPALTKAVDALADRGVFRLTTGAWYAKNWHIDKPIQFKGEGTGGSQASGVRVIAVDDCDYLAKFGHVTTGAFIGGLEWENVRFEGNGKSFTDAIVVLEGITDPKGDNWSINNGVGRALRMRGVWQANFSRIQIRNVDASVSEVVLFDSIYNSDPDLNCNIIRMLSAHIEGCKGTWFRALGNSNLDGFELSHSELEAYTYTGDNGPWPMFDFVEGTRIHVTNNEISGVRATSGYSHLFKIGSDGSAADVVFKDNWLARIDSALVLADIGVNATAVLKENWVKDSGEAVGTLVNNSKRHIDFEFPMQFDSSSGYFKTRRNLFGFIPAMQIQANSNKLVGDTTANNIAKTVVQSSTEGDTLSLIYSGSGPNVFRDFPLSLRIVVRAKSDTGAGQVSVKVRTLETPVQTAPADWTNLYFTVIPDHVAGLGDSVSDRLTVNVGTGNPVGENVQVDGIFVIAVDRAITEPGAPTIAPVFIGQEYLDTANSKWYKAKATSGPSDWVLLN